MARPKKIEAEKEPKLVEVKLKCMARNYSTVGKTLEEAVDKIKIGGGAKAMSIMTVIKDGITREKFLNAFHTSHLFGNTSPTSKQISMQWIKKLFNG